MRSKGKSIVFPPKKVKFKKIKKKIKQKSFLKELNFDLILIFWKGLIKKIKILNKRAITPPILFGIDRKIAYANKKYHSGLMWIGVTIGLASIKFSESTE